MKTREEDHEDDDDEEEDEEEEVVEDGLTILDEGADARRGCDRRKATRDALSKSFERKSRRVEAS